MANDEGREGGKERANIDADQPSGRHSDEEAAPSVDPAEPAGTPPGRAAVSPDGEPYRPEYSGFNEEETRRANATADRSRETAAGPRGEYADETYVEQGPAEAQRRRDALERERGRR